MNNLKSIWKELTSRYSTDEVLVDTLWSEIEMNYTITGRHYHNLTHLDYMMKRAIKYKKNLIDPDTVMFSVFYHDIVYIPKNNDNEQRSADIANDRLQMLEVPADKIIKCRKQILATENHIGGDDNDTNYLLDFDVSILGDTPKNYRDYLMKIRKEYSMYPDTIYKEGRKRVLQHLLRMDRIFKTAEFYDKYEQQARVNLEAELDELY